MNSDFTAFSSSSSSLMDASQGSSSSSSSRRQLLRRRRLSGGRVQFATDAATGDVQKTYAEPAHELLPSDLPRLWWQNLELTFIRKNAQQTANYILDGGDKVWEQSGQKSFCKSVKRAYKSCFKDSLASYKLSTQRDLEFWVTVGHARRGLERYIVSFVTEERQERKRRLMDAVLFVQDRCYEAGMTPNQTAKLTRAASERESCVSVRFAIVLGRADATAVQREIEQTILMMPSTNKIIATTTTNNKIRAPQRKLSKSKMMIAPEYTPLRSNPHHQRKILSSAA